MAQINQLISNFYTNAVSRDFARDINFRVTQIVPPASIGLSFSEDELVFARAAKVPGRNIGNVEAKYLGLTFNLPGVVEYPESGNYSLEFYCDQDTKLRNLFEQWSRYTFDDTNNTGNYVVPGTDSYIELSQLKPTAKVKGGGDPYGVVQTFKLVGVSIRSLGEMEYKMAEGKGDTVNFTATFAYHYYTTGELTLPEKAKTAKSSS